ALPPSTTLFPSALPGHHPTTAAATASSSAFGNHGDDNNGDNNDQNNRNAAPAFSALARIRFIFSLGISDNGIGCRIQALVIILPTKIRSYFLLDNPMGYNIR